MNAEKKFFLICCFR